jgi:hypothetical protein
VSALEALQACLAAEHAAVYGYGVLGGALADFPGELDLQAAADDCYAQHRASRDELTTLIAGLDTPPAAALPAYDVGGQVDDVAACRALARTLEQRTAYVYGLAISQTVAGVRNRCAGELTACALRLQRWGQPPEALPGLTES